MRKFLYKRPSPGAQVAQLVEQRTENPCVGGSIPPLGTIAASFLRFCIVWLPSAARRRQCSRFRDFSAPAAMSPDRQGSISASIRNSEVICRHRGSFSVIAWRPIDGSRRSPATRRVTPTRRPSIRSAVTRRPSAPHGTRSRVRAGERLAHRPAIMTRAEAALPHADR